MGSSQQFSAAINEAGAYYFYLVTPIGFEKCAEAELKYWLSHLGCSEYELAVEMGGIEIQCPLAAGLALNHCLKIPSRILLRLKSFRCRDFVKLFKMLKKMDWKNYVGARSVDWIVASSKSRVKIKSRIEKTCQDALIDARKAKAPGKANSQETVSVFVRFYDDTCTVSLDTSGDHLHRRGQRILAGNAPIRENLAAGLLWEMLGSPAAYLPESINLIDPMTGSGTFSMEAIGLLKLNFERHFTYQNWQIDLSEITWPKQVASIWKKIFALDVDGSQLEIARKNISSIDKSQVVDLETRDFFDLEATNYPVDRPLWLVANPPYGVRLGVKGNPLGFFEKTLAKAFDLEARKVGLIFPADVVARLKTKNQGYRIGSRIKFKNGGIDVVFLVFEKLK